jgi:hypothetical protein
MDDSVKQEASKKLKQNPVRFLPAIAVILLIIAGSFAACGKEKEDGQDIVGTWIKETVYSDGTSDTIVFTNDFRVEKYLKRYQDGYKVDYKLENDTLFISVNRDDWVAERCFKYSIAENKLTIIKFTYPFSFVAVVREDVIFKKVK